MHVLEGSCLNEITIRRKRERDDKIFSLNATNVSEISCEISSVPHNTIMDLFNVMGTSTTQENTKLVDWVVKMQALGYPTSLVQCDLKVTNIAQDRN